MLVRMTFASEEEPVDGRYGEIVNNTIATVTLFGKGPLKEFVFLYLQWPLTTGA